MTVDVAVDRRRLSELVPDRQSTGLRELVMVPFPALHRGQAVTVKAVFERTGVVRQEGQEPYLARLDEVEVDPGAVEVMSESEATSLGRWRRLRRAASVTARSARPLTPPPAPAVEPVVDSAGIKEAAAGTPGERPGPAVVSQGQGRTSKATGRTCRCGRRLHGASRFESCLVCRRTCPGCGGYKAPVSDLCRECRHRARADGRVAATTATTLPEVRPRLTALAALVGELRQALKELCSEAGSISPDYLVVLCADLVGAATDIHAGLDEVVGQLGGEAVG